YLMMWFSRPEFDRECWFHTDADVRGGLPWELFCYIELPIPSLEKQRDIVKEYNTVISRIKLNEQLNQKLDETAQALYKHWFVNFEFPNKEGKPYKSSGGAMEFNEELDKEIPVGWDLISIHEFCTEMKNGGTPNRGVLEYWDSNDVPWLKTGEIENNIIIKAEEYISQLGFENSSAKLLPINAVLMAMYGATAGQVSFLKFETSTNQACCAMICENKETAAYLYYYLLVNQSDIANMAIGGAQPNLSKKIIETLQLLSPKDEILLIEDLSQIIDYREILTRENHTLLQIKDLFLSKMTRVEEEEVKDFVE
ncbi:MAG: restriction endonuclease subunit S, partial [Psychroserpens sp.]|nr:restriction endonuclease subunit S [Psychroserpens sp.]